MRISSARCQLRAVTSIDIELIKWSEKWQANIGIEVLLAANLPNAFVVPRGTVNYLLTASYLFRVQVRSCCGDTRAFRYSRSDGETPKRHSMEGSDGRVGSR